MTGVTVIVVKKPTRERMKKYRITSRETYDEIINRLLDKEDKVKTEKA